MDRNLVLLNRNIAIWSGGAWTCSYNDTAFGATPTSYISVEEIMGANDNEKVGLPVLPKAA